VSIRTLLVANRGEIARRVMRSAHAMGIRCVAVYVDADAEAPHVSDADEAVRLAGSYLDGAAILEAARASAAEAIHPGYGFLAENAAFAREVRAAGRIWVGPAAETIERMGDKLAAKALAEAAGVRSLPSAEDPGGAGALGYPLLVKAAAGGGGRGMRRVEVAEDLEEAIAAARREAGGAFGDDRIFLERLLPRARHIEIQILGDAQGSLVHLGERECSIQRRHQKVLEESPSTRIDPALRKAMGEAALRLGRALAYQSAGTVEFLLDDDSGEFFFLEVNTRLQVEHPVTEAVTGIDLVREQLRIAAGEALGFSQEDIRFQGAAIEARLYAEDPGRDFLPASGTLVAFEPAPWPELRWECGVEAGSKVGTSFDPLLAKVISHAPTRREAASRLALGLERLHLGGVTTNRDFLVATLRSPAFLAGETTTDFIARVGPERRLERPPEELDRACQWAALWLQGAHRAAAPVLAAVPSGWRNARLPDPWVVLAHHDRERTIRYRRLRDGRFRFEGGAVARIHSWSPHGIDVEIDAQRCRVRISRSGDRLVVQGPRGDMEFLLRPRFEVPGSSESSGGFIAAMPGKVLELRVRVGERVSAGETLVVLEAMKMEHPMRAAEDGVVSEVCVREGDQVEAGTVLLVVEPRVQEGRPDE